MELTKQLAEHQAIRGSVSTVVVLRQMVIVRSLTLVEMVDMWLSDQWPAIWWMMILMKNGTSLFVTDRQILLNELALIALVTKLIVGMA